MTAAATKNSGNDLKTVRDTLESIWVAIVLAFVLRAFFVEAFVIPTGSMAPRLYGQHFSLQCPACGYDFAFGADVYQRTSNPMATCPNCAFTGSPLTDGFKDLSSGKKTDGGDRVLVLKYLYQFRDPQRWDVVVFLNPQDNRTNYIKRLIGLPGETVEIVHGDIFVSDHGKQGPFKIQQKPDRAQDAMWQIIYDNDYQPNTNKTRPYAANPPRWEPAGWEPVKEDSDFNRAFELRGGRGKLTFVSRPDSFWPNYGYNPRESSWDPAEICTDLKLSAVVVPKDSKAKVTLQTTSFDYAFLGEVSAEGKCRLKVRKLANLKADKAPDGEKDPQADLPPLQPGQACQVALTHADMVVTLWVGGKAVLRKYNNIPYARLKELAHKGVPQPTVAIEGEGSVQVRHLQLMRDVFYTNLGLTGTKGGRLYDVASLLKKHGGPGWGTPGHPIELFKGGPDHNDRDLDEFFVLGDNSPNSLDSRGWIDASPTLLLWRNPEAKEHTAADLLYKLGTVPRYSMKGKAMFVYWPAGFRAGGWPVIPNVGRMRLIR